MTGKDEGTSEINAAIDNCKKSDDKGKDEDLELLEFQRRKQYNNQLLNILKKQFIKKVPFMS